VNWDVVRREWGAVTFVLTVVAGLIVVPIALYFANVGPSAIATPNLSTSSTARSSSVASPTPSPSPKTTPAKTTPSPTK
jgi:hypothetical protein